MTNVIQMQKGKMYKIFIKGKNEPMNLEYTCTIKDSPEKRFNGHWFRLNNFHNDSRIIPDKKIIKIEEI